MLKHPPLARLLWIAALAFVLLGRALAASPPPAARGLLLDATLNGHVILAVGERGAIIRSVDSGETWETIPSPTRATLTGIAFGTPLSGWAVGHDGVILHTRDGGETWSEQFRADDPETVFLDVAAMDSTRALAVGAFGRAYGTRDSGRTWSPLKIIEDDHHLNRISPGAPGEFYVAGERGALLHLSALTKEPGVLASPDAVSFYGVHRLPDDAMLAYGLRGHLFRSEDRGGSWQEIKSPQPALLATAVTLRSGVVVLAGQARAFLISRDSGRSFQSWEPPITTAVAELLEAPNGLLLAFGEAGVTRLEPPPTNLRSADSSAPPAP
jgi:photosystem II stability/assembly factor-like uncharacterized protein